MCASYVSFFVQNHVRSQIELSAPLKTLSPKKYLFSLCQINLQRNSVKFFFCLQEDKLMNQKQGAEQVDSISIFHSRKSHKLMQMYVGYCEYIFIAIFTTSVICNKVVYVLSIMDTVLLLKP